jgi:hypothetical protein
MPDLAAMVVAKHSHRKQLERLMMGHPASLANV